MCENVKTLKTKVWFIMYIRLETFAMVVKSVWLKSFTYGLQSIAENVVYLLLGYFAIWKLMLTI